MAVLAAIGLLGVGSTGQKNMAIIYYLTLFPHSNYKTSVIFEKKNLSSPLKVCLVHYRSI